MFNETITIRRILEGDTGYAFSVMIFWAVRKLGGRLPSDWIVAVPPSFGFFIHRERC
jgi:hypothetical protein